MVSSIVVLLEYGRLLGKVLSVVKKLALIEPGKGGGGNGASKSNFCVETAKITTSSGVRVGVTELRYCVHIRTS
ncbi:hypothetical protein LLE87_37690, partial [Paenibacillus polymyxa]|nr:hypothetical protein [Paenibacillus polymyxa]